MDRRQSLRGDEEMDLPAKFSPAGAWFGTRGDLFVTWLSDPQRRRDVWGIQETSHDYASRPPESRLAAIHWTPPGTDDPRLDLVKQNGEHGDVSADRVSPRPAVLFVAACSPATYQSSSVRGRGGDPFRGHPAMRVRSCIDGAKMAETSRPAASIGGPHATGVPGGEFPPTPDVRPDLSGGQEGNIWMAYGFFRYDFQGLDQGQPHLLAIRSRPGCAGRVEDRPVVYLDDTTAHRRR